MVAHSNQSSHLSGIVFDIQRTSLHDGPGLRTTVFLKGCPLRCAWCHNPESQKIAPQTGQSGKVYGQRMSVDTVMQVVEADRGFYESSGGGLTLSGGEPTVQFGFCLALLQRAKESGIHTVLDTCGQVDPNNLAELIPWVDLFHFDLKLSDNQGLRTWTGANGNLIEANLAMLEACGSKIVLRCPIIPGVNDTRMHAAFLDTMEASGRFERVERLPYHTSGLPKYADLGLPQPTFV